jgi:zinc-ribbon domain
MQQKPARPTGVTILGVLAILAGLGGISVGALALGVSGGTGFVVALGAVFLILGILELVYGVGLFGGKGWAWTLAMIGSVLNIIVGIAFIATGSYSSAFGVVISLLILYYLTRPRVKGFFGKGGSMMGPSSMQPPGMSSMPMGSMGSSSTMGSMGMTCKSCGASIPAGATRCPSCGASV